MWAFIMMIAVLLTSGEYATFSETFGNEADCRAKIEVAKRIDLSQNDSNARIVYAECIKVEARDPIGLNNKK
jgi:hypothetical protein